MYNKKHNRQVFQAVILNVVCNFAFNKIIVNCHTSRKSVMDTNTEKELILECRRIADELLAKAEKTDHGWTWSAMFLGNGRKVSWADSETIYNGVSGFVLLYIQLYKYTKNEKYFEAASKGIEWADHFSSQNETDYYAFFTGRLGVSYAMIKMHDLTGDRKYLDRSAEIAREAGKFIDYARKIDDLINGISGAMLGLLHIHAATGDDSLLPIINSYAAHLIERSNHGEQGLYWDKTNDQVKGLCGFSHGAGGIGFAFLELAHYLNNDAYYYIAEQAFLYETHNYDQELGNWPDFRKSYFDEDMRAMFHDAYKAGNAGFFTKPGDMSAWCHGAPGIGFSRLRAFQLLKDPKYKKQLDQAVEKTKRTTVDTQSLDISFTLCHGGGGNAMLFLDAYRVLGDQKYLELAEQVAVKALRSRKTNGLYFSGLADAGSVEDTSLFMGNAGIAYFYLQLLDPANVPSVLAPTVKDVIKDRKAISDFKWLSASRRMLEEALMRQVFPRTMSLAEKQYPSALDGFYNSGGMDMKGRFIHYIQRSLLPSLDDQIKAKLNEIFSLELEKLKIDESVISRALLRIESELHSVMAKMILSLSSEELLDKEVELNHDIRIIPVSWDWSKGQGSEEEDGAVLLKPFTLGVMEEPVQPFLQLILESFMQRKKIKDAAEELLSNFEINSNEEREATREAIIQQIKQAMLGGLLVTEQAISAVGEVV
jgi:hypothetical protein